MHKFWAYPSSYVVLVMWGTAGFGYQPTLGAFLVHFGLTPALILIALWLARHEGHKEARKDPNEGRGPARPAF